MFDVEGILAPVFTPMTCTGSLNLQVIPAYMAHLKQHNIDGILVGGTTGEGMSLSVAERKILLEAWMTAAKQQAAKPSETKMIAQIGVGGTTGEGMSLSVAERKILLEAWVTAAKPSETKVIAQIGGAPLPDVLELAKHAENLQVDAIMTLPELYYKPKNVNQLVSYLETISKAAPTRPLLYYHFPMMTGVDVNIRKLITIASSKIPNFKGVKADLTVANQVDQELASDQRIFIANHLLAAAASAGHTSSIATVSNIFPEAIKGIVNAVKIGDVAKADILQKKLNELVNAITSQGDFVPSMKAAMELVTGISVGQPRLPLSPLDQNQLATLEDSIVKFVFSNHFYV